MDLAYQLSFYIPFVLENLIILVLIYAYFFKKELFRGYLQKAFKVVLGLFILYWLSQIVLLYISLMTSGLGKYLTIGWNNFFLQRSLDLSIDFIITLIVAILGLTLINLIRKKQTKLYLDEADGTVFFVSILAVSWINFFPLMILAFLIAIVVQIILTIRNHQSVPLVTITSFVLIAAVMINIAYRFHFYQKILHFLALI